MSATKNYYDPFLDEQHHTDDTYEDFLRMQKEHQQSVEFDLLQEEEKINLIPINWELQAKEFLSNKEKTLDVFQSIQFICDEWAKSPQGIAAKKRQEFRNDNSPL